LLIKEIRNFQKDDMPLLKHLYRSVTEHRESIFWWVGDEENWVNVFCAFENDQMVAKGQVDVITRVVPGSPLDYKHKIYINLKTISEREDDYELLDLIYQKLFSRAMELKQSLLDEYKTLLCVGNYASEVSNNKFFLEIKGFSYMESEYSMNRDLNVEIEEFPLNKPFQGTQWRMESPAEEKQYLDIEAEIWPKAQLGLKRLREYKSYPHWTAMVVREAEAIVGSLMAWEEETVGIIEDVFVRESWRKRGIAKHLLTEGLKYLKGLNLSYAQLSVLATNQTALSLYKAVGFIIENESIHYCKELD
jgi:ribosomal protein S18 acetylase RimI-like enzyme